MKIFTTLVTRTIQVEILALLILAGHVALDLIRSM